MPEGSTSLEQQSQVPTLEVKHFTPDHKLTPEETMDEANRLIGSFVDVYKKLDFHPGVITSNGSIFFGGGVIERAEGIDDAGQENNLSVMVQEGEDLEVLHLTGSSDEGVPGVPKIVYFHKKNNVLIDKFAGDGVVVDAARTLLAKTQKHVSKP